MYIKRPDLCRKRIQPPRTTSLQDGSSLGCRLNVNNPEIFLALALADKPVRFKLCDLV